MEILDIEQGSAEWAEARLRRFTSSDIVRLMTDVTRDLTDEEMRDPGRSKGQTKKVDLSLLSPGAMTYVYEKCVEELTGLPAKKEVSTDDMEWGKEWEPEARRWYELVYKVKVRTVGIIITDKRAACSPDGLVGEDGGTEFKCPNAVNHFKNLLISNADDLKQEHPNWYWQIQDCMFQTGRKWWDWASYHPYFEGALKMHKVRIYRNEADIENISIKRASASQMTDQLLKYIQNR